MYLIRAVLRPGFCFRDRKKIVSIIITNSSFSCKNYLFPFSIRYDILLLERKRCFK